MQDLPLIWYTGDISDAKRNKWQVKLNSICRVSPDYVVPDVHECFYGRTLLCKPPAWGMPPPT